MALAAACVNEASALAATATTTAVIEAAEKEVVVKVDWLKSSMPNARHKRQGSLATAPARRSCCPLPAPLGTSYEALERHR